MQGKVSLWFWCAFSWRLMMLSIFSYAHWPSGYLLWKKCFCHNWMLSFIKNLFLHLLRFSWFIFCNWLMWCITLIDLWILRHPHIPGINLSWSYYINPFNVVLNFVCKYFVEDFCTSLHQCYWSVHFCCCCYICVLFWCQVNVSFAEWV